MNNAANTVICLHLHDGTCLAGFLVSEEIDRIIIPPSIHPTAGTTYQHVSVQRDAIEQRYSIPIVWW